MRIQIASLDRLGISQEILAVCTELKLDLVAMEVSQYCTYIQVKNLSIPFQVVVEHLNYVDGVQAIKEVDLLPGERKSKQLEVLLAKIPDPIIDIDKNGVILVVNKAAEDALSMDVSQLVGKPIGHFIKQKLRVYLTGSPTTQELSLAGKQYFADITPVKAEQTITGAVLVLRSLLNVGRHLSHLQTGTQSGFDAIIGHSIAIKQVIDQTKRFANLTLPVLITGETGTGKELLAKALHDNGNRANKPFLAINCASLPEHLLESELFGYESGAFTGAQSGGKPGLFELADGGSVFLDEIAEMPTYLQVKLLRFLQDFMLRRVGGVTEKKVDVRIISATHQNVLMMFNEKTFREDLYYRLNVLSLHLPSLKERKDDIPLLVEHFISNAAKQVNLPMMSIRHDALQLIKDRAWPGNIRQLQNVLFRSVALSDNHELTADNLLLTDQYNSEKDDVTTINSWALAQEQFEQKLLTTLYPLYPTTRKLAERLSVSHNKIAMKLRKYGIHHG